MITQNDRDQPSNSLSTNSESFKYKTNITGNTYNVDDNDDIMTQTKLVRMKLKLLFQ